MPLRLVLVFSVFVLNGLGFTAITSSVGGCSRLEPMPPLPQGDTPAARTKPATSAPPKPAARQASSASTPSPPALPPAAPPGDLAQPAGAPCGAVILLSEFMPDPKRVPDHAGEFLELYNPGAEAVSLNGYRLTDGHRDNHLIPLTPPVVVPPGGTLVLAGEGDPKTNGGSPVGYVYDHFHLSNQTDRIRFEDPCGVAVIDVAYPSDPGMVAPKGGASLTRDPRSNRWRRSRERMPSGDYGSPGIYAGVPTPK